MTVARHLLIEGRVQGVFFRASTRREARRLGVVGWVKNLPDGRVEAVVQGEPDAVDALVQWCHHGTSMARVDTVTESETDARDGLSSFEVRY